MLKKLLLMVIIFPATLFAAQKECPVKPSYNIAITKENVHIFNKKNDLMIKSNGEVVFNEKIVLLQPPLEKQTQKLQTDLRQQLPKLEQEALSILAEIKITFESAIKNKLGNDNELYGELNKLYKRLVKLLHKSIISESGNTQFYYQNFNNLKKDGEEIGKHIFYNIVGGSIINFDFLKNYGAIKQISKNEWKAQKPKLKAFDAHICSVITNIDGQYQEILTQLNQSTYK
ncbi:hypothetical protein B6D12_10825 [Gilliamella apicola]|uniref:DUF2884 family protein n=3 Tax=Gilliamella apicola TaxID=1196095 RepID=UPI000A3374DC|nr:DUF2884 family protein [Gilliamella apicola]OTP89520.1 hypothetical protein B5S41_06595 [Gilliamella apicola]OTP93979.1 hypothetical protein B6D13_08405 [Gilliamella apicola]OTP94759.1 hypothetical protein B6D05_07445 [Gilliamella apicola]OTQ02796.1 hypothetical protein B6D07_03945 [Gilliamella apicola]OTQ04482.1 hypothetical protein B6D12_10825 [Gilliamella apicola]